MYYLLTFYQTLYFSHIKKREKKKNLLLTFPPSPPFNTMIEPTATTPTTQPLKIMVGADSFWCALKDTLVSHLYSLNIKIEDLGTSTYYSIETLDLFCLRRWRTERERGKWKKWTWQTKMWENVGLISSLLMLL